MIDAYLLHVLSRSSLTSRLVSPWLVQFPFSLISQEMSSDEYFDELDSAFLQEVEAIEATHTQATRVPPPPAPVRPPAAKSRPPGAQKKPPTKDVIEIDDSDDFGSFAIDDQDLEIIDKLTDDALRGRLPVAGPSRTFARTNSRPTVQTTLDGTVLSGPSRNVSNPRLPMQRKDSSAFNGSFAQPRKTKQWDHTAFAKSGWRKPQSAKGKEKAFGSFEDEVEDEEEEEPEEFEQFPAPFVPIGCVIRFCMLYYELQQ